MGSKSKLLDSGLDERHSSPLSSCGRPSVTLDHLDHSARLLTCTVRFRFSSRDRGSWPFVRRRACFQAWLKAAWDYIGLDVHVPGLLAAQLERASVARLQAPCVAAGADAGIVRVLRICPSAERSAGNKHP